MRSLNTRLGPCSPRGNACGDACGASVENDSSSPLAGPAQSNKPRRIGHAANLRGPPGCSVFIVISFATTAVWSSMRLRQVFDQRLQILWRPCLEASLGVLGAQGVAVQNCRRNGHAGRARKAALKRPHSKRSALVEASDAARQSRPAGECGRFSAAFRPSESQSVSSLHRMPRILASRLRLSCLKSPA